MAVSVPEATNEQDLQQHRQKVEFLRNVLSLDDTAYDKVIRKIESFQVAVPSWALGTGGTRFGRFPAGGEPRTLEEKIEDVGLIHQATRATNSISLHIPWDIPKDATSILELLRENELIIDSVNSNTFQDQADQKYSYKFGSLCHTDDRIRKQAVDHNIEVVEHGIRLNSKVLTVWLADGSNFPGQHHFRKAYARTLDSLQQIYKAMPGDWNMLIEYKPYEPGFYSTVIPDWGTSYQMSQACGDRANVLVDLGHHLPNTNIEQIVARLLHFGRLGGFHFNGSHYGDDDLTTGSIKPYQLFLIFNELVAGANDRQVRNPAVAYMIDASHNIKDPIEDLINSLENIRSAYAKALLVNVETLEHAQHENDVVLCEQILQAAFQTDVRPLLAEARLRTGGSLDPIGYFRSQKIREKLIARRGKKSVATGL
ncbi:MAG: sugar isomerase [Cyclobacteriaceae bacterium]|nr:sugar isomerase [Cyclobacteriaceae bacterium]MDH4295233.1 sugar isomerase [Cyclobacteriaceae bacterium]MDH5250998.1 sugar isomerase [Cyclobacteriaceae bacterium]